MFTFDNTQRTLTLFLENPSTEFHLREIARKMGLSPAGTLKILKRLTSADLVKKEKTIITDNYRANLESLEYQSLKKAYNLYLINSSGLVEFLDKNCSHQAIVLFGSFARGDNTSKSDIDIAVLNSKHTNLDLKKYQQKLGHKINVQFIDFKKANPEFKNNLVNGITLKGFVEVF
ncbi:nucleotidyltransferase domain-containing protein [Candidatus Woesearchaeota archaeon]|nr:nucleotidyltransferase domain-containing protein [Candidatus Woesearchaeota archaeon]